MVSISVFGNTMVLTNLDVPRALIESDNSATQWRSFEAIKEINSAIDMSKYSHPDSLLDHVVIPGKYGGFFYDVKTNGNCTYAFSEFISNTEKYAAEFVEVTKQQIEKYRLVYENPISEDDLKLRLDTCKKFMNILSNIKYCFEDPKKDYYVLECNLKCTGNGTISWDNGSVRNDNTTLYGIYSKIYAHFYDLFEYLGVNFINFRDDADGFYVTIKPDEGNKIRKVLYNNKEIAAKDLHVNFEDSLYVEFVEDLGPCATPTIAFENGQLVYATETEGAEVVSEVTVADAKKSYTNKVSLTATYEITAYASGYDDSDKATATLVWATATFIPGEKTGAKDIIIDALPLLISQENGMVTVNGLTDGETIEAYTADGKAVTKANAIGDAVLLNLSDLKGKVAVLSVGGRSCKIAVK